VAEREELMTKLTRAPSRRLTRALALVACGLSALAIVGASAAAADTSGPEEKPASATSTGVPTPASGVFTEADEHHTHGVLPERIETHDGQFSSVFDSSSGYYSLSEIRIADDPRPSGR
jgi:hypothetical protein